MPRIDRVVVPPKTDHDVGDFGIVMLEDDSVGFFYTLISDTLERVKTELEQQRMLDPIALSHGLLQDDLGQRALALGALNAMSQHLLTRARWTFESSDSLGRFEFRPHDKVGMVGLFPSLAARLQRQGVSFTVIERRPETLESPYTVSLDPTALESCNKVLVTASTLLNDSLEDVLSHCQQAKVAVIGPTAGCLPDALFARGVAVVGGSRVIEKTALPVNLACGEPWTDSVEKYTLVRGDYPGIDRLLSV